MKIDNIIIGIFSKNEKDIVNSLYQVDGSASFRSQRILTRLRELVDHSNIEIAEIAIFRLLVRIKDIDTLKRCKNILLSKKDESTRMAIIYGLIAMINDPNFINESIIEIIIDIKDMIERSPEFNNIEKDLASELGN